MSGMRVVVMGVSGCGKSAVGEQLAQALGLPLIEGDSFHPPANIDKMSRGLPLDDTDRAGWLDTLGQELARRPAGAVLTCSALKAAYRERLRAAAPGLRFVHLSLTPQQALGRVATRKDHFYPASLVDSQFAALEDPGGEPGVVVVDASQPMAQVVAAARQGLAS
ncbi:gluconokinase [Ramlibacter sp. Leaf400]|uniref:gluconokinase n=1 Tax=Ramlibacter sp. Leaf400 TaxID=1736365 RepID=UPI0006F8BE89|nr:gluconokinase [Ramlibacter sp. Leaf400]KQT09426.1 gluconokinase [Ramlibacter sp. Leaf400]